MADVASRRNFCESSNYKANLYVSSQRQGDDEDKPTPLPVQFTTPTLRPNPTSFDRESQLCFDKGMPGGLSVKVVDAMGRTMPVRQEPGTEGCITLYPPKASGVYVIQMRLEGNVATKRWVVQ